MKRIVGRQLVAMLLLPPAVLLTSVRPVRVDGKIPPAGSQGVDRNTAWCVLKAKSGDRAAFTFEWASPVEVSEIVYFGRTAWYMNECWKDYEVYLHPVGGVSDGDKKPAAKGTLKMIHGPQRIKFPKTRLNKITVKFLNSYGGLNPGAAEMMVFAQSPPEKDLAAIVKLATLKAPAPRQGTAAAESPKVDQVDREKLRGLITRLMKLHGSRYAKGPEHLARLDKLTDDAEQLIKLQGEVLLFDVERLLVIKRHEITASHVYTYHYEGQRDGGGLYAISARDGAAEAVELVATPGGQLLDCDLSYDGRQVLFSWRRGQGQGYHVWSVNIDGTGLKQLTDGEWHDSNACWLPDGDVAFLSTPSRSSPTAGTPRSASCTG